MPGRQVKHAPFVPTEADLRAAHASSRHFARVPFEKAMADVAMGPAIRKVAELRARHVPATPETFELTQ